MTRTTIVSTRASRCTLRYEDESGAIIERDFFAPYCGGYVREDWMDARQVCERLSHFGNTLIWRPAAHPTLADLIRTERRAALARTRREFARD